MYPCLAVAILCVHLWCGLVVGVGQQWPVGFLDILVELHLEGLNGEKELSLAKKHLHRACFGHSFWACHPGVCPQGLVPSELLTASDSSAEGKGNPGRAAGSGVAWSLQVTLWVTWVIHFS